MPKHHFAEEAKIKTESEAKTSGYQSERRPCSNNQIHEPLKIDRATKAENMESLIEVETELSA